MRSLLDRAMEIVPSFDFPGDVLSLIPYGSGHINDTFLLETTERERYCLQRINPWVFKNPTGMMKNIERVSKHLEDKILARGGNPRRERLSLIPVKKGGSFVWDDYSAAWRLYQYIEGTTAYDFVDDGQKIEEAARAFSLFTKELVDLAAPPLEETIANFHDTKSRYLDFQAAVEEDPFSRCSSAMKEISFLQSREGIMGKIVEALDSGDLPLRTVHNDTKINNVLFDLRSGSALCVIDLDTVMPGTPLFDFGDGVRMAASTGREDERQLGRVRFSIEGFECFAKGYMKVSRDYLSPLEMELMPWAPPLMTLECGMRFLSDYLLGDEYFKTSRRGQNLDRCRTQLKVFSEMEQNISKMEKILKKTIMAS